jgi:RNA-directed DNA polymerase
VRKGQLARNLATSLTLGAWSEDAVNTALQRRLPPPLRRLAGEMSKLLIADIPGYYAPDPKTVEKALLLDSQFARIYRFCHRRNLWPDPDLFLPVMAPTKSFADLNLPQLPTVSALAEWLFLPLERLEYLADVHNRYEEHGETSVNHYHYVLKPKKSGGLRVIEAPKLQLKSVQRQILRGILDNVPTHPDAFGFVKGRNCLDAASRHAGEQVVVCFDLKDFFPSIRYARVLGLFRCLGYPLGVARYLAALCTSVTPTRVIERLGIEDRTHYQNQHLPQGSPASPSLANNAAFTLDKRLSALARSLDANFSRYADDLSFSGDRHIVGTLLSVVPDIVREEGFNVNTAKTRVNPMSTRQTVTGIVVNRHLNVKRDTFDELKAIIHACGKAGDMRMNDPMFQASLVGKLDWVERVNRHRGQKLKKLFSSALSKR